MAFKFKTTRELARVHGVKVLVYGKAGAGKTQLVTTTPRPLLVSVESGLLSLRNYDIPVIEIKTLEDLENVYEFISGSEEAKNFDTICVDSLTEVGEVVLTSAKSSVKDVRQAYGTLLEKMQILVKKFRDLKGKNVYFTAQEERFKDESTGIVTYQAAMPGSKLGMKIPYHFDELFNLGIGTDASGKKYRFLRTAADFQYDAKDRSGALAEIEPADLSAVFAKIGAVEDDETPARTPVKKKH